MYKKILAIITMIFLVFSCGQKDEHIEVTYNLVSAPSTIDPHLFRELISVQLMSSIYSGLLTQDKNGNYIPELASSYKEEGNKLIFKIRKGLKWSDGTPITIDDIIYGFRRALSPKTAARYAELLYPIKNAEKYNEGNATDKDLGVENLNGDLVITLEKIAPHFKYILTLPISFPVKNGYASDISDYKTANYSGPYVITSMNSEEIKLTKNKCYWDKKDVKISDIKYLMVRNFSVVEKLIKNGELDISRIEPFDLKSKKDSGQLVEYQNGRVWYLGFNMANELLNKKENRLAIMKAIDRSTYVKDIKQDGSTIAKSVISPIIGKYREKYPDNNYFTDNIKTDILKGKTLRLLASNTSIEIKEANFIQEELRKNLGLNVAVSIVSFKERLTFTRQGNFDIVLDTYSPKFDDPISMLNRWYKPDKPSYNAWPKEEYDKLIERINNTTNQDERYMLMNKAERILVDNAVIAPLYYSNENWFVRSKFKNIVIHPIKNTMEIQKMNIYKKKVHHKNLRD